MVIDPQSRSGSETRHEECPERHPRRRPRHPALSAHRFAQQAGRAGRRQVSADRHPHQQLHQQRLQPHLRPDAVPQRQPAPAHRQHLQVRSLQPAASSRSWPPSRPTKPPTGTRAPPTPCGRTSATSQEDSASDVLILSGDQLYRMDFRRDARQRTWTAEADVTIAVLPVPADQTAGFGIVRLDETGPRRRLRREAANAGAARRRCTRRRNGSSGAGINSHGRNYLASMGIYLFNRAGAARPARPPSRWPPTSARRSFRAASRTHRVQAHLFDGYWEDLGTIKSYHEANLALAGDNPPFDFHSPEGRHLHAHAVPARLAHQRRHAWSSA